MTRPASLPMSTGSLADKRRKAGAPLSPAPANLDVPQRTVGLLNPDGIIAEAPGVFPKTILYLQKQVNGDRTGTTALPVAQQCGYACYFQRTRCQPRHRDSPAGNNGGRR